MMRVFLIGAGLALTASAAQAQPCLTLSDGFGTSTVTCPDGRSGLLHTDPVGGVTGQIGGQPYVGASAVIDPVGTASGGPSAGDLAAPPPPSIVAPGQDPAPSAPVLDPLAPQARLTELQREYQAARQSLRLRQAERAKTAPPSPGAAPGRSTRPAGSGRSGGSPD